MFGLQTAIAVKPRKEKIIDEIDTVIYEIPDHPKLELSNSLLNALGTKAEDNLKDDFVSEKTLEEQTIKQIKEEYNFDEIKDAFDNAVVPQQLGSFYSGDDEEFIEVCNLLSPDDDNSDFKPFLCSEVGQNIMTNNSLSINVENRNIFCRNFNTNKNFDGFLVAQQDESKLPIPKRNSYHHSFEKYIKSYLPYFPVDEAKTFDRFSNKSSTYLLCKFNNWLEFAEGQKNLIRHVSKSKGNIGLKIIEEKDKQFLIEKLIHSVEKENLYKIATKKNT